VAKSELQEFIRAVPLFAGLLPSEVERITMVMNPIDVAEGEVVCTEGEAGHEFYVIASGEAAVEHAGGVANKLHTGDHFGELALLDRGPRSATVRALTDCRLYVLQEASFAAVLNEVPALAQKLLASLARRLRQVESQLAIAGGTRSAS
jgi:CRP-like cAMP-binding protein